MDSVAKGMAHTKDSDSSSPKYQAEEASEEKMDVSVEEDNIRSCETADATEDNVDNSIFGDVLSSKHSKETGNAVESSSKPAKMQGRRKSCRLSNPLLEIGPNNSSTTSNRKEDVLDKDLIEATDSISNSVPPAKAYKKRRSSAASRLMNSSQEDVVEKSANLTVKKEEEVTVKEQHAAKNDTLEGTSVQTKTQKRRRSSVLNQVINSTQEESPDALSRYGRTRKPKYDHEDFLPTEAVLGKSPPKGKKSNDALYSPTPNVKDEKSSFLNGSLEEPLYADFKITGPDDLAADLKAITVGSTEVAEEKIATEYEPGDLIWGRLGHHPFWPCIIINDPVDSVYFKRKGRGVSYHVLFYGDNGKRSWVASSMILQFLGIVDFEMQVSAVTKEMKKTNPKWFSGFFVKTNTKEKWEAAVQEAEEVMPMTRDERLDAFLATMHLMKGRKSKVQDEEYEGDENTTDGTEADSPVSIKKKKQFMPKTDSPSTGKKKRGRPRKIDGLECHTPESGATSTPIGGRASKRKLLVENDDSHQNVNDDENDDPDWKSNGKKRKRRNKKDKKKPDDKAFSLFAEKHLQRIIDDYPEMSQEEAQNYLHLLWDKKDEDEKNEYVCIAAGSESEDESQSSEDEENDGRDDTGVEEEVATVESAGSGKETDEGETSVVIKRKKINLFRGYKMERVCQNCEKPGNTVRCRGPCAGVFHVECALGADNSGGQFLYVEERDDKPKKRGRKKKINSLVDAPQVHKRKVQKPPKKIYADEETDSDLDYMNGDALPEICDNDVIMKMIFGDISAIPQVSVMDHEESEEEEEEDEVEENTDVTENLVSVNTSAYSDFRCGDCAVLRIPLCFVCGRATDPSGEDSVRIRCSVAHCGKHYHIECLKVSWPQANYSTHKGVIQNLTCPQHVCHTCVSDNPKENKGRFTHEKHVRCIRCPTSYHYGNYCVPAGSEILTASQIICPKHYEPRKKGNHHVNASWCFICSIGGSLICCDLCPSAFHVECLKINPPSGGYICEDCETGRFPLYNEVLWVKLGHYRWWPSLSLFPTEAPESLKSRPHKMGEFAVRFLGTNDHYWIERGRCFVYHEGDCVQDGKQKTNKSYMDTAYQRGVLEANELHKAHKEMRAVIQSQSKPGSMKPPQYTKIKTNKPVGSVKTLEVDTSNIAPCECKPHSNHPCSTDSECLNRILMVECDPETCPAGEKCENQAFARRLYPSLTPYCTNGRGWGLKALEDIKKGQFVIEYVGEVIDDEEYQTRLIKKHEEKDENYYFLTIDSFRIIDAGPKGNVSRFMNHSCQPNCETQKWTVAGDTRVGLFALCDIPDGTELTFNYNLESKGNEKKPCMCGAPVCSGFIGAKKSKVPQADVNELSSTGKKKRRKPRVRNLIEDICFICDGDRDAGVLISCINKECASKYHLNCLRLTSLPLGKWLCPRHRCNVCQKRSHQWCSYCTDSYCPAHLEENLVSDPLHGDLCEAHQKNPLDKEHLKKKRDDERKRKEEEKMKQEEEKRKQYEEERAMRRNRREQISNEGEVAKSKRSQSDLNDAASEASAGSDDKLGSSESLEEVTLKEEVKTNSDSKEQDQPGGDQSMSAKETPKSDTSPAIPLAKKRGRKKKIVTVVDESIHSEEKKDKLHLGNMKSNEDKSVDDDESQITSSCNDDIPDADPALDKFIVQTPAPIDDEPLLTSPETSKLKKLKVSSPKSAPSSPSPGSITKRRRKPPMHKMDYVNTLNLNLKSFTLERPEKAAHIKKNASKTHKETRIDKDRLIGELEDLATGFASDDGQDPPKFFDKKASTRGKGKRMSLGISRRVLSADSTTNEADVTNIESFSPIKLKSPVRSSESPPPRSSEKLSASQIFAMQRAKGLKVMPPNRRLSMAREQELNARPGNDIPDRMERAGKGLKIMKGRRFSVEADTSEKKTENLHGGILQSGVYKKGRPVLLKVEDNGVSTEDDMEDKVVENGSHPIPNKSQPHLMQSPPSKKIKSASPKKQSSEIGVSSIWNQDILNILK